MSPGVCEPEVIGRAVCVMTLVTSGCSKRLFHASRTRCSRPKAGAIVGTMASRRSLALRPMRGRRAAPQESRRGERGCGVSKLEVEAELGPELGQEDRGDTDP